MYFTTPISETAIWSLLNEVRDPEIPVISIVELGVVRRVIVDGDKVEVIITPTYSGCPAMRVMEEDIIAKLNAEGISSVTVKKTYSPAWTTDWINPEAREKLRQYGIAPPLHTAPQLHDILRSDERTIVCPQCGSHDTVMKSLFGSTPCKALYVCGICREPFDYFKCI